MQLVMTGGLNAGQYRTITANTAGSITVSPGFFSATASGDTYQIIDSAHQAQETYRISVTDPAGVTDFYYVPTTDIAGTIRVVKSSNNDGTGSMTFYNASGVVLRKLDLPAPVIMNLVAIYQLGSKSENPGTTIKSTMDNFRIVSPLAVNTNPYSNEATVTYTYPNDYPVVPLRNTTINTTPAFLTGDGDCTCTVVNGATVCTPGKAP
jgi:hypothetical protein